MHRVTARPRLDQQLPPLYVSSLTIFFFLSGTVSTVPALLCLMRLST